MRKKVAARSPVSTAERTKIENGFQPHEHLFLTSKARDAKRPQGRPHPANPYVKEWHEATAKEIFAFDKGKVVYSEPVSSVLRMAS